MPVVPTQSVILPSDADVEAVYQQSTLLPNPLAASAVVYTATGTYYESFVSLFFTFTTDATVGNRIATLRIADPNGATVLRIPAPAAQPASQVFSYTFALSVTTLAPGDTSTQTIEVPPIALLPGWTARGTFFGTGGIGDQVSTAFIVTQRYISGFKPEVVTTTATPLLA